MSSLGGDGVAASHVHTQDAIEVDDMYCNVMDFAPLCAGWLSGLYMLSL